MAAAGEDAVALAGAALGLLLTVGGLGLGVVGCCAGEELGGGCALVGDGRVGVLAHRVTAQLSSATWARISSSLNPWARAAFW